MFDIAFFIIMQNSWQPLHGLSHSVIKSDAELVSLTDSTNQMAIYSPKSSKG